MEQNSLGEIAAAIGRNDAAAIITIRAVTQLLLKGATPAERRLFASRLKRISGRLPAAHTPARAVLAAVARDVKRVR